eukprot:SAG31_NODE_2002_length_6689_cov_120.013202_2_plen_32_part_00
MAKGEGTMFLGPIKTVEPLDRSACGPSPKDL